MKTQTVEIKRDDSFLLGIKDCVPTLLGYLSIGFAAGVVEKTAGLSIAEIALLSLLLYAGSGQFIAAGMIATSTPAFAIIFTIFFVNLRHLLMSAALSPYFRKYSSWKNMMIGTLLTDETFGVAIHRLAQNDPRLRSNDKWMMGLNITAYLNWLFANIAGGLMGEWIPNPEAFGLDFALPAMFVGLLVLQVASRKTLSKDLIVAISAACIVIAISLVMNGSIAIIAATIIGACIGMVMDKWK